VILVDANLLLYAHHPRAGSTMEAGLGSKACSRDLISFVSLGFAVGLSPDCNQSPRVRTSAVHDLSRSGDFLMARSAGCRNSRSGPTALGILRGLVRDGQAAGPLVMDAVLAAIALERGAMVSTTDRDFSRFSGLKWTNPLGESR